MTFELKDHPKFGLTLVVILPGLTVYYPVTTRSQARSLVDDILELNPKIPKTEVAIKF